MIVKNEAELLPGCLDSVRHVADEICIVDTGSKDGTLEIARDSGALVSSFEWCDDFSRARNASLAMCSGDWVFVLDADERLASQDLDQFVQLLTYSDHVAYRFLSRNYTNNPAISDLELCANDDAHSQGFLGWYPSYKVRLFPNHRGISFDGAVHELVNTSLAHLAMEILLADLPVHHYPLMKEEDSVRAKQEMYIRLGKDKLTQDPDNAELHAELAVQYGEMGDCASAVMHFKAALQIRPDNAEWLAHLGAMLHLMGLEQQAHGILDAATRAAPELFSAWLNLGVVAGALGDWAKALACFEKAIGLRPYWQEGQRYLSVARENLGSHEPDR